MHRLNYLLLFSCLLIGTFLSACSKDDEDTPTQLSVSPSQISLSSEKNSTSSFTITANKDWSLTCDADWIALSAQSGTGSATITITALSQNTSTDSRAAVIAVLCAESQASVVVTQLAEEVEPTQLSVSPTQISLLSDKNSTSSFTITANKDWTLTCDADWIALSAQSGTGSATITMTALSQNASASTRTATITVQSAESQASVSVTQLGAFKEGCVVNFKDIVTLSNSVAFKFDMGPNVDYFSVGYIKVSATAGWTDEKIIEWLSEDDNMKFNKDSEGINDIWGLGNMASGTAYYLVSVAFDNQGTRGEITKLKITTPQPRNIEPIVPIDDVKYSNTKWYWTTYPNAATERYFMIAIDMAGAHFIPTMFTDAEIASMINDKIKNNEIQPLSNTTSNFSMSRDSEELYLATWAKDVDGDFACIIYENAWMINSNGAPQMAPAQNRTSGEPYITHISQKDSEFAKNMITIFNPTH